ncbi:hypothetical protein BX616_000468 [Lobosporangium transversale]|uniref:Amine oxidase domain-containing protein n=1 Tax=Lobosporangium transversale TaxID=64571 RepID=A0A1Y2H1B8_9FUNG|nr:hypothetical protein BCR41DRAFT_346979 [Lobosporangium transversale]KAF9907328.1 hypothetical protein BX616_000468 [Lobosporangium transversale]ORZ26852.1 hypothetical protein BCR41DRAFT_346979 [Lobosporangium transversale]|eukprot:XP_021884599.1 hypothetical protein BCR41DRAFT_346979 [Lobosporangium transversale]
MAALPTIIINGHTALHSQAIDRDHVAGRNHTDQPHQSHVSSTSTPKQLRVAVVGSGLAGLTIAHLLSSLHTENGHGNTAIDVHVFEEAHKFGMDAASLSVPCPCQECVQASGTETHKSPNQKHAEGRMDVPMRSFFPEYYPNLVRLYRSIGVKFQDADNTLSCFDIKFDSRRATCEISDTYSNNYDKEKIKAVQVQEPYLSSRSYKIGSQTITLPDLPRFSLLNPFPFGRRIAGYVRIAYDYLRMLMISKEFLAKGRMMDIGKHPIEWGNGRLITLREFLEAGGYSQEFCEFFVPLFASVCTCSFERMMEYPACAVLEYVARCMPFGRMQFVSSGVQDVAERLAKNIGTIHFNTRIERVVKGNRTSTSGLETQGPANGPVILVDSRGIARSFDHVVFATQANQAAFALAGQSPTRHPRSECDQPFGPDPPIYDPAVLESIEPTSPFFHQIKILAKFPYERTRVVCHTDKSFLPKNQAHWRLLNIAKSSKADVLASPLNKITRDLELEMEMRSKKAKEPRATIFSLKPSALVNHNHLNCNNQLNSNSRVRPTASRRNSSSKVRTHFTPLPSATNIGSAIVASTTTTATAASSTASLSHNSAMATHIMNSTTNPAMQRGWATKFLQTTNPIFLPRPETVLSSTWFERAVVNPVSTKAVDELQRMMDQQTAHWVDQNHSHIKIMAAKRKGEKEQDCLDYVGIGSLDTPEVPVSDRIWFVGSYAYPGIPLLEGCVVSALQVCDRIRAIEASRGHPIAPSVSVPTETSFLKRAEALRGLQKRDERVSGEDKKTKASSATVNYFQTAWKDAQLLDDDQSEIQKDTSETYSKRTFSVAIASNFYVQVAWMLLMYAAAVMKWCFVLIVESFGGDGSRWALA